MTIEKLPEGLRAFDDTRATRDNIYNYSLEAIKNRFPIEDDSYRIDLLSADYDGKRDYSLADQKKALLHFQYLTTPIRGRIRLTNKTTGDVVEERDETIARVPYYSDRGTLINNGSEYSLVNQSRLMPGVYTRMKRSGEPEAQFNVSPGVGTGFRMSMNPDNGVFNINIRQSSMPAYSFLKAMGVTDQDMENSWGKEIWDVNMRTENRAPIKRIYEKLSGYQYDPNAPDDKAIEWVKGAMAKYDIDPRIVKRTLGVDAKNGIDRNVLLRTTQKILNIGRGEEEGDDRDSPRYKKYLGPEDLLRERIDRDSGRLTKDLLYKVRRSGNLSPFRPGHLSKYFDSLLVGSGLALPLEETNPLHYLEQMSRVTAMGEGGIQSSQAVTDEARDINANQLGFLAIVEGPENEKIGVDARFSYGTYKGKDGKIYGKFVDARSGKEKFLTPADSADMVIGFPGFQSTKGTHVYAIKDGKTTRVPRKEVDAYLPSTARMFSQGVNMNNMPTGMQAGRQFYAAKFMTQFLPLKEAETPLVDSLMPDGKMSFREYYGRRSATIPSTADGMVTSIKNDVITVTDYDGKKHTYDAVKNFPFNRLSGISYTPVVKEGDTVTQGQMLAKSNFTNDQGAITLGRNLKAAIIPFKGKSNDDAIVISETAAKKLAADRLYGFDMSARHGVEFGKGKYRALFPDNFTKDQYETLDEEGVVKPGTVLSKGDPIILGIGPKLLTAEDAMLGKLHKVLRNTFNDKAIVWEHEYQGTVVDAVNVRGRNANVNVITSPPVAVGDKLSSDMAIKGVVGRKLEDGTPDDPDAPADDMTVREIRPDSQMPQDAATGEPFEMLINPITVLSRVSPNQIVSLALAKVAKKTGKQIRLPQDPPEEGWAQYAANLLEAHGLGDTADLFDPESGKIIKDIGDGYIYMSTFHHLAEKKLNARGGGGGYDIHDQPSKGGFEGAKRISGLDRDALISHGVPEVIKDSMAIRGTKNEDFWKALRQGNQLPPPTVPFIYNKFINTLKAGGVNVIENGSKTKILPMTDKAVDQLARHEINDSAMLDADFFPRRDGLFDPARTGGASGLHWTYIKLDEPVPNPVMEEPIRRVLGLTVNDMEGIISGTQELNGKTGGKALKDALANVNPKELLEESKTLIRSRKGSARDNAVKVAAYMSTAIDNDIDPSDWMVQKIPVIPPRFRPIARIGDTALVSDLNELYKDLIELKKNTQTIKADLGDEGIVDERKKIYEAVKAVYGLGDPITPEGQSKHLKGALWQISGDIPKTGMAQSKLFSKTVDSVSRGVLTPDPNLDMDTVGIPEDSAWVTYKDFVLRRLSRRGYPHIKAMEMVENRDPTARMALVNEMQERPLIINRAPTLHKFNLMAFKPTINDSDTITMSPLNWKGYNADADGDMVINYILVKLKGTARDLPIERKMPIDNDFALNAEGSPDTSMNAFKELLVKTGDDKDAEICILHIEDFPRADERAFGKMGTNGPIDFYAVPDGIEVAAYDEATATMVWAKPTVWSKHYGRKIEIVTFNDGSMAYTDDDPRAVYGIAKDAKDLTPQRFTPTEALERMVASPKVRTGSLIGSGIKEYIEPAEFKGTPFSKVKLDFELGQFIGVLIGDGWWDHTDKWAASSNRFVGADRSIHVSDNEGYQADAIRKVLSTVFNKGSEVRERSCKYTKEKYAGRYGDTTSYAFGIDHSVELCTFLTKQLGGEGTYGTKEFKEQQENGEDPEVIKGCYTKHLPEFFLSANREFRRGLLAGLIATDGSISYSVRKDSDKYRLSAGVYTSSFRLAIETRLLAISLGIRATITGVVERDGIAPCWAISLSTPDVKNSGALDGMCNTRKLDILKDAEVTDRSILSKGDGVVFPDIVSDTIIPMLAVNGKYNKSILSTLITASKTGLITKEKAKEALDRAEEAVADSIKAVEVAIRELKKRAPNYEKVRKGVRAIIPSYIKRGNEELYEDSVKLLRRFSLQIRRDGIKEETVRELSGILSMEPYGYGRDLKTIYEYRAMVYSDVCWVMVDSVDKTDMVEDGYDLTVPGYDTFMSIEGLVLSNTMTWHVPVSAKAVAEAYDKMLPSKNLFALTDLKTPMQTPRQEMSLGLYYLTRQPSKKKPVRFRTSKEAVEAYRKGKIRANDPITIG